MPRYIEQLNENITPASGDWLWIVDVSAEATDQDRKLSVGKLALLATANVFTALLDVVEDIRSTYPTTQKTTVLRTSSGYAGIFGFDYGAVAALPLALNEYGGNVLIGTTTGSGKLTVDQSASAGAIPVLVLDQADLSEEFIEFAGTVGTGNSIEAKAAKTLTTTHFLRMNITGVGYVYMPVGTIA